MLSTNFANTRVQGIFLILNGKSTVKGAVLQQPLTYGHMCMILLLGLLKAVSNGVIDQCYPFEIVFVPIYFAGDRFEMVDMFIPGPHGARSEAAVFVVMSLGVIGDELGQMHMILAGDGKGFTADGGKAVIVGSVASHRQLDTALDLVIMPLWFDRLSVLAVHRWVRHIVLTGRAHR